jgi:hypothetical protein
MKKVIYIIPGFGETCKELRYKKLAQALKSKEFAVHQVKINWNKPISTQVFNVERDAIVIGFSFGALIAYLIVKQYPYRKAIFASMSPIDNKKIFGYKVFISYLQTYMSQGNAEAVFNDISKIKIDLKSVKIPYIRLAGEYEKLIKADILIPKTEHWITPQYIKVIKNLV